jgi:hypothetical protein
VAAPQQALYSIGEQVGIDFAREGVALDKGEEMSVGHTIAGNRIRMAGSIKLSADTSWKQYLTPAQQRRILRLAGGMARRYGYV